jgi:hypothetical protein
MTHLMENIFTKILFGVNNQQDHSMCIYTWEQSMYLCKQFAHAINNSKITW